MATQPANKDEDRSNRTRLLQAAGEAFGDTGYDGTSLRTIADNAGVAFQLIAYYFGSKEDLWKATVDHLYERYVETGKGLGFTLSGNIFAQFHNHLRLLMTDMLQRPQLRKIWIQEQLAGSARYTDYIRPKIEQLHEDLSLPYFKEVVRLGIVRKFSPQEVAVIWGSMVQNNVVYPLYVELQIGYPLASPQSIEAQVDLAFRILTDGALNDAEQIDRSARSGAFTTYQDRLCRMEADMAELKQAFAALSAKP